ncbi:hypothetical protein Nepgr_018327 [Nepenthes gracilis]|uniref:Uncharacterized protein n=1 Tax=Nepenthes gracilis TaxID=150966 RepID=A0AAD3XU75_NEPGR|nr:hypothetical protein Nepgr_018327 [Nepenthes gracilis]
MEDYSQMGENTGHLSQRHYHNHKDSFPNFAVAPNMNNQVSTFQLQNSGDSYFQAAKNKGSHCQSLPPNIQNPILRGNTSTSAATLVYYPDHHHHQRRRQEKQQQQLQKQGAQEDEGKEGRGTSSKEDDEAMKAKIIAHPQYSNLLQAYMDCQKVGAPPEVVARLAAARHDFETRRRSSFTCTNASEDPELDQFMEAYYNMLVKYKEELTWPVQEAMDFMRRMEAQLNLLSNGRVQIFPSADGSEGAGSSEEEQDNSGGEREVGCEHIDPRAEDQELKNHLLRKYGGYLSSLKQELSKKKKKGKLPKEARQKLLSWWELHYKWPYPSETEKVALAEATGLDQKQINNWFINQRKRHWKPSEDMQFMVMDGIRQHNSALYMEGPFMVDGPYRFRT